MISRRQSPLEFLNKFSSIGGRVLSHYEIGPLIGGGTMGQVYRAVDTRLDRPVAIKVLHHWARGDARARERLRQEARLASAISHPNIVAVHAIDEEGGVDLLVMEHLEGKTLAELIPSRGFPVPRALHLAIQAVEALTAAHFADILHRDIKPSNIMIIADNRVKVLDFGLAVPLRVVSGNNGTSTEQPGTKVYMAPEQLKGKPATQRSEIFSLGIVLHQMLSGKHPFGSADRSLSPSRSEIASAIRSKDPLALPPKVPRDLTQVVRRCLSKNPEKRFESMQRVLKALCECKDALGGKGAYASPNRSTATLPAVRAIRAITRRIGYGNVPQSRQALDELTRLMNKGVSRAGRDAIIKDLRDVLLTLDNFRERSVPPSVRAVRIEVLKTLKLTVPGRLGEHFEPSNLQTLDLYGMDFSHETLHHLSFRRCFLVETKFRQSDLTGASFAQAFIRNVDFTGATLDQVDFSEADWFNAVGLTANQLRRSRRDTLRECPPDIKGMHAVLDARYIFGFDSWDAPVQKQLIAAWRKYLRPGGLRDVVASWRRTTF